MDLWGLDPIFDAHVRISISSLLQLDPATSDEQCSVFLLPNESGTERVISKVRILGDVVALEEKSSMWAFTLDDGTGLIRCVLWKDDATTVRNLLSYLCLQSLRRFESLQCLLHR
jgi:hypothetical protein